MAPEVLDGRTKPEAVVKILRPNVPVRPRFLTEVVLVPFGDEIIVDGTSQLQVLQGHGVQRLFSRLVLLMDGNRSHEEIERALSDVPAPSVRSVISALQGYGLIETEPSDSGSEPLPDPETLSFFRRYFAATGVNASGLEAQRKLRSSEVVIFGSDGGLAQLEILKSLLEKTGVGRVTLLNSGSLDSLQKVDQSAQLVVLSFSFGAEDYHWHTLLDNWCFQHQVSWFRAVVHQPGGYADLGPLFTKSNPCYRCFAQVDSVCSNDGSLPVATTPANAYFWMSRVAIEIIYLLSGIGPIADVRSFQRIDFRRWSVQHLRWPRVLGCSRCRPLPSISDDLSSTEGRQPLMDLAVLFEDYVSIPPRAFLFPKMQASHVQDDTTLIRERKRLLNCTRHALNRQTFETTHGILDVLRGDVLPSDQPCTTDDLGTVLMVTAGVRGFRAGDKGVQRWAATGGNLGSVELYVVVRRIDGLSPGIYFYEPYSHSLARFRRRGEALSVDDFIRRVLIGDPDNLPDVLVIFTAAFHRVARKYGAFGYRLVNQDAGVAVSQLQVVAKSLSFCSQVASRWADDLIEEQLNLDPPEEQCTAVVALCHKGNEYEYRGVSQTTRPINFSELRSGIPHSAKLLGDYRELPLDKVVEMLYHESRVKETELRCRPFEVAAELLNARHVPPAIITLPPPPLRGRGVAKVLATRTSVRLYAEQPVSLEQLGAMLYCAHLGDQTDWPDEHHQGLRLSLVVLALRVAGLDLGVHEYYPVENALGFSPGVSSSDDATELFVQPEFARAPLVVWIVGNLAAASARHGAFGHRQLLLRAGAAGNRLWMAALGMGLSGTLTAGLVADAGRQRLGLDGYKRAALLAFVAGYGDHQSKPSAYRPAALP